MSWTVGQLESTAVGETVPPAELQPVKLSDARYRQCVGAVKKNAACVMDVLADHPCTGTLHGATCSKSSDSTDTSSPHCLLEETYNPKLLEAENKRPSQ